MNEPIEILKPCVRGCTRKSLDDTAPVPLAARHGGGEGRDPRYCDRCFYRTDKALRMTGELVEWLITQVGGIASKVTDGSQRTKKDPPLPFNVDAFNDANETYSRLVYWCSVWATALGRNAPAPAARAWRTDNNRVVGLPADIQPAPARYAVAIMALWLSAHLEDICRLGKIDDVDYFHDELKDLYRLAAKWPREDQPIYAPVQCPDDDCKGKIALHPPKFEGDDQLIVCESCGRVFEPDDYDQMASVFRQVRTEQAREVIKAHKVAQRLARKYGGAA